MDNLAAVAWKVSYMVKRVLAMVDSVVIGLGGDPDGLLLLPLSPADPPEEEADLLPLRIQGPENCEMPSV